MDNLSTQTKQYLLMTTVVVAGILLWSSSKVDKTVKLPTQKTAVPRTEGQKSGFPSQEGEPDYQPASQTNKGKAPSYSQNSNLGK